MCCHYHETEKDAISHIIKKHFISVWENTNVHHYMIPKDIKYSKNQEFIYQDTSQTFHKIFTCGRFRIP